MADLANPPYQKTLSFLEDVEKKVSKQNYKKIYEILKAAKDTLSEKDLNDVAEILRDDKPLMLRFNMFLKGQGISYWTDSEGKTRLMFTLSGDPTPTVLCRNEQEPEPEPASRTAIIEAALELEREVLSELNDDDRTHIKAVLQGEKTSLQDLEHAVNDILTDGKNAEDTEKIVLMFGVLLPTEPTELSASIWTSTSGRSRNNKKVALWSSESRQEWTFYQLDETTGKGKKRRFDEIAAKIESDH